ncbi:MAG: malonic semialdehyde reductase [Sphingomonadales bacterium]
MADILSDKDLDTLFREARSYNTWADTPISDVNIQAIYELMKWGPTSANCSPARFVWVRSPEAKEKLAACVSQGNTQKVLTASATVIVAHDLEFYERIPELFPHNPGAKDWFSGSAAVAEATAFRNGTLQGAYLMLAARSLGFDCGPMSGFDNAAVDDAFFAGTTVKSNFICAIGKGTTEQLFDRSPRLAFDDANQVL